MPRNLLLLAFAGLAAASPFLTAQTPAQPVRPEVAPREKTVNLVNTVERTLRYRPEGTDFVIENGGETYNRSLYGTNSAFRVDGGDRPLFGFWLPRRGGTLRVGVLAGNTALWLDEAAKIVARYRAGSMLYEITDPRLGGATVKLDALPLSNAEGLILRTELAGATAPLQVFWAYGGADLANHNRNADIGTNPPPSQFFRFQPQSTQNDRFSVDGNVFGMIAQSGTMSAAIVGLAPQGATWAVGNGSQWNTPGALLASAGAGATQPVAVGRAPLPLGSPVYVAIVRLGSEADAPSSVAAFRAPLGENAPPTTLVADNLAQLFTTAEARRLEIADKVVIETPDPFINAAAVALNLIADGIWDEPAGVVMHGGVAWRSRYLGWRGVYANSYLGWQDRAARNFRYWAERQNTTPFPDTFPPADARANLSRNEAALHTIGLITHSSSTHYDMNLVFIDALFRYLQWTGDLALAREMWPVLERHLAWERRLFRRPYGADGLPLYEAYAAIWASDDLEYHGGGTAHASAYNYYHNLEAARLAKLLGHDPAPYQREAELIRQAMERELWLPEPGVMAEFRDFLGPKEAHASPALWTFYHTVDSEAVTPQEAWQMTRFIDETNAHLPLRGPGVPTDDNYYVLASSDWMPYTYSINNVVLAEVAHTALGYWQTGRTEEGFRIFKSALLDGMFMGLCPGNAGMTTTFDAYRGESQRDFSDPTGILSRDFVEGLFGLKPDVLTGQLTIRPGFPARWASASIKHPQVAYSFQRKDLTETYTVEPKFSKPVALRLQVVALRDQIASVTVNGQPAAWRALEDSVETPRIEITAPAAARSEVVISWQGNPPAPSTIPPVLALGQLWDLKFAPAQLRDFIVPGKAQPVVVRGGQPLTLIDDLPARSTWFARLQQGVLRWQAPVPIDIRPGLEIVPAESQPAGQFALAVRNNSATPLAAEATVRAGSLPPQTVRVEAPAWGLGQLTVSAAGLLPGTHSVTVDCGHAGTAQGLVTNWNLPAPAATKFEPVNLATAFNDQVTNIFRHEYLTPRSPFASLAIPKQGIGSWASPTATANIDDRGLRQAAEQNGGRLVLPDGVPFATPGPGNAPNIAFTSQWDNFPREITVPLAGRARHAYFLLAGSTNWMQSRHVNGELVVTYADGTSATLPLINPTTWWPINEDYYIDDFQFRRPEALPPRVNLATGQVRILDLATFKGKGDTVRGGAATVLDLPLDSAKDLRSLTVRARANEVVVGLMAATLAQ